MERRIRVVTGLGAALVLGVTACSGGDGRPAATSGPVVRSGPPPSLSHAAGAVDDVEGLRCSPDARGRWAARGTVRNDTGRAADYAISVFVVRTGTGTVLGQASRVMRVAAGAAAPVVLERVYAAPRVAGLRCVPHVERVAAG